MPPFGGQPRIVEIKPADRAADVPGRLNGVENMLRPRYARALGYHGSRHDRAQVLGTFREPQREKTAAEGVHQAVASRLIGIVTGNLEVGDVVGDGDEFRIRVRSCIKVYVCH